MAPAPVRKFRVRGSDKPAPRAGGYVLTERGWRPAAHDETR